MDTIDRPSNDRDRSSNDPRPRFLKDAMGRTIFYPYGLAWNGSVIADGQRETALREAASRYSDRSNRLTTAAPLVMLPFLAGFYFLASSHPFEAFAVIIFAPWASAVAIDRLMRIAAFGDLLAGLESAPCAFPSGRKNLLYVGLSLVAASAISRAILFYYDQRIAELNAGEASIRFYPDISWSIIAFFFGAFFLAVTGMKWTALRKRWSTARLGSGAAFFATMAVASVMFGIAIYFHPSADIVVTPDALFCKWHAEWAQIEDMQLVTGSRGQKKIHFTLAETKSGGTSDRTITCAINGLNADERVVYAAIHNAWRARRR